MNDEDPEIADSFNGPANGTIDGALQDFAKLVLPPALTPEHLDTLDGLVRELQDRPPPDILRKRAVVALLNHVLAVYDLRIQNVDSGHVGRLGVAAICPSGHIRLQSARATGGFSKCHVKLVHVPTRNYVGKRAIRDDLTARPAPTG